MPHHHYSPLPPERWRSLSWQEKERSNNRNHSQIRFPQSRTPLQTLHFFLSTKLKVSDAWEPCNDKKYYLNSSNILRSCFLLSDITWILFERSSLLLFAPLPLVLLPPKHNEFVGDMCGRGWMPLINQVFLWDFKCLNNFTSTPPSIKSSIARIFISSQGLPHMKGPDPKRTSKRFHSSAPTSLN